MGFEKAGSRILYEPLGRKMAAVRESLQTTVMQNAECHFRQPTPRLNGAPSTRLQQRIAA